MPRLAPRFIAPHAPAPTPDVRPSASRRFYGRDHERWRKFVITNHPICRRCELSGRLVPAAIGHHLIEVTDRPDLRLVVANGVGVCGDCHNAIHRMVGEVERFRAQMRQRGYGIEPAPTTTTSKQGASH